MRLKLGISPCPNDTFAFHAILNQKIDLRGLELDIELLDVQELNEGLAAGAFDFSKASFHAALHLAEEYGVIDAGAALGFGVGPLLLAANAGHQPSPASRVLCPGPWTTATLLLRCLYPELTQIEHVVFSEIMPALEAGEADLGVVIHEGRFVYRERGLVLVEDLGERWERLTHGPLPLGGLLGRKSLPADLIENFTQVLRESIEYARDNREEALETMREWAQESDDEVIWAHVELYVNDFTDGLRAEGREALHRMQALAREHGLIPAHGTELAVF